MEQITFVVGCKGRLSHLQATLPLLVRFPHTRCIVVDFDCPDKSGDWVEKALPAVQVIRVKDRPTWSQAEVRNVAVREVKTPWICFTDSDIIFQPGFLADITPRLQPGCFVRPQPMPIGTAGTMLCTKADFDRVGGYDELFRGWGFEDSDLVSMLKLAGVHERLFPGELIVHMEHDDTVRVRHHENKDLVHTWCANRVYSMVKLALMEQMKQALTLPLRRKAYEWAMTASQQCYAGQKMANLVLSFENELSDQCPFSLKTSLSFALEKK